MIAIETIVSEYQNPEYRISDFLKRRKDVLMMFNRDITLEEIIDIRCREAAREAALEGEQRGERRGEQRGEQNGKILAYHEFGLSTDQIAERLSVTEDYVQNVLKQKVYNV